MPQRELLWSAGGGWCRCDRTFCLWLFSDPAGLSEVHLQELHGIEAEVITSIPADSVGEIAFVAQGGRVTYTAKSADSTAIPRGTTVMIEKVVGGVAIVQIKQPDR